MSNAESGMGLICVLHFLHCRFSEEEVSLDEMLSGSSAYLKEDYIKRKFMDTWEELCALLKISSSIEVAHEDKEETYSTPYPEINRRVQRLLKTDEFPDYIDVCELVDRCNTKHKLGIGLAEKTQISEKLFKTVGKIIKCRRSRDYRAHFGSHLTDAMKMEDDPATSDSLLLEQLQKSLEQGKREMQSLVDDFVVKQDVELERKGGASPQGDSCNDEEEEEEEEGEEVVCRVDSEEEVSEKELSPDDKSPLVAKRIKLDPDSANGVSSYGNQGSVGTQEGSGDSPTEDATECPSSGAQERNRGSPGSGARAPKKTCPGSGARAPQKTCPGSGVRTPQKTCPGSGAQEESSSSSSSIDVGDDHISTTAADPTEIIIPDSDSDVVIIDSD